MKEQRAERVSVFVEKRKRKKTWHKVVSVLASIVVFCTTYALILPAITLTESYYCGIEEHTHTDDCFFVGSRKTCVCVEEPHCHDYSCYDEYGVLTCGLADFFVHTHDDICYDDAGKLVCELPEISFHQHTSECYLGENIYSCGMVDYEGHVHTEACYVQEQMLVCSYEEGDDHIHGEECYSMLPKLVCTMEEGEFHLHTEACQLISEPVLVCGQYDMIFGEHSFECMDENGRVLCGQVSVIEHTHTEECFVVEEPTTEPVLICELNEHTHALICTSDKTADLETAEIWRTTLPTEDELTGIWADDLLTVAKSQLGYQESDRNFEVTEDGVRKGYSRYGQWYGIPYGDWCAMYVSFCLHYTGIPKDVVPYEASCQNWVEKLTELELYYPAQDYEPVPGDIIFFGTSENVSYHVGLVTEVFGTEIKTIEGNHAADVAEYTYEQTDPIIMGYGSIEAIQKRGIELGWLKPDERQIVLGAELDNLQITLIAAPDTFPGVSELILDVQYLNEIDNTELKAQLGEDAVYTAIQLHVLSGGAIIQPNAPVQVRVGPFPANGYMMAYTLTNESILLALEAEKDAYGFATLHLTELQPIVLHLIDGEQDEKTVAFEADCNGLSISLTAPQAAFGEDLSRWQLAATEPEEALLEELHSLAGNNTCWQAVDVSLWQGWDAAPDLMGGTLSFHLNNAIETEQLSLYQIINADTVELVPVEYQTAEDGSLIVEEAESGIYAFAYTKQRESLSLETYYENLHIVVKAPAEAFVAEDGDLVLTAVDMDAETLSYVSENIRLFQNIKGFDLQVLAGDIVVEPEAPVEILITDDGLLFSEKTDFMIYQYNALSEIGTTSITEVPGIYNDGVLKMTSSCLSGFVITHEEPYDGIQLEADYGDIRIRLLAPTDAFPVTAENLTLVVKDPEETMKARLQEAMGDEQEYFAVDIQILCDGEPIQPHGDVQVIFEMKHDPFPNADAVEVFHVVEDEENQLLDMQQVEGGYDGNGDVVMETNHFSTYVVKAASAPVKLAAAGSPTNTWQEALTDRSNNVGVTSEGYSDSPYDFEKNQPNLTNIWTTNKNYKTGGTFFLKNKCNQAEKYWDGSKPFRITSASEEQAKLWLSMYSDLVLEDNDNGAPYGALKLDNVSLLTSFDNPDIHARGNKLVIGENVTTNPTKRWRIFGGATQYDANDEDTHSNTNYITNVIVNSGTWAYVYGGGLRDTNHGTQVTIRNEAIVGTVYGGGRVEGDINNVDNLDDTVNIYIEGGTVGEVFGGNETEKTGLKVNGDIKIDVSGGKVGTIYAGNDHRKVEGTGELKGSKVRGGAVVNIYNTGSVTNVVGDYTHYDAAYGDQLITFQGASGQYTTKGRHIRDLVELNIHSNNDFEYMDYWDVVRINNLDDNAAPNSVNVTSKQGVVKIGDRVVNNIGSEYIGRIEVTNGGRFYVKDNCFINFMNEVNTTSEEGVPSFDLDHAWKGEPTEVRRAWSTLAVEGSCIEKSTADTHVFTLDNPCDAGYAGLRIKGNVEGFSTLEACGTPMYSTGDTYYYYVVADSSDNGGKAFREPEGAPYVVCYRYLEDGRIGWYLRERPVLTMSNSLVRVGTEGTLTPTENGFYTGCPSNYVIMHVDMKGFAYEWSSNPGKNRVDFEWTIWDGYENATSTTGGISIQTMADIANNVYSTSNPNGIFANVEYKAMGSDEGSTEQTKRVSSFYVIIDTSKAENPRYYDVSSSFHYTRGEDNYDDLRVGQTADAARCTYDFDNPNNDIEDLPTDGYSDSIMTTFAYKGDIPPKGADDALLRVYLPEGVSANTLTVKEVDGNFTFKETGISASLVTNTQVNQNYETEEESIYNHQFGVTLQQSGESEIDLAGGATLNNLSGKETYHCAVYSHAKISFTDITPESNLGLQLQLQLNSLTKGGNAVGIGDPSAVNDGELRIQVLPVGTIIDTTKISVEKRVTGATEGHTAEFDFLLSYPKVDANGNSVTHEERFTLKHGEVQTFVVPVDTKITVQEIKHDGYYVQAHVQGEGGDAPYTDTITVTPDKTPGNENPTKVIFYNTTGAELPDSGGSGTQFHTLLGLLLTLGAFLFLWMHRRKGGTVS